MLPAMLSIHVCNLAQTRARARARSRLFLVSAIFSVILQHELRSRDLTLLHVTRVFPFLPFLLASPIALAHTHTHTARRAPSPT